MSFIWPVVLLLLPLVPAGVALYLWLERRRRRRIASYGFVPAAGATLGGGTAGPGGGPASGGAGSRRRLIAPAFFVIGLTIMVVALARPQGVVSLPRIQGTVMLTFDVSGSMAADDLKPTRMEAAKAAAREFVERQPAGILIGVVSFSDSGFSIQPPTNDQTLVDAAINRLAPTRGTSLARGIATSLNAIAAAESDQANDFYTTGTPAPTAEPTPVPRGTHAPAVIVLLTDGENNQDPDPLAAAQAAADRGVRIDTVGIGSSAGADLTINGFKIHTQLDEATLKQISQTTDGTYYNAASVADLHSIYDNIDTRLVVKAEPLEVTSIFAGAGLLALVLGAMSSLIWLGRAP